MRDEAAREWIAMGMAGYSLLLALGLGLSAPWWLWQMAKSGRYREGLGGRFGRVPPELEAAVAEAAHARQLVWLHAVSVGEVLAVERLVAELRQALPAWVIAVSTTTATGQAVARKRLAGVPVFFFPLDFAFAVRQYLRVLRPSLVVLVESELWPRLLAECERARVPVAVVNARVSDRSFRRTMRVRGLWLRMAAKVTVFLAQGEESAGRLRTLGVAAGRIAVSGNLKYDLALTGSRAMAGLVRSQAGGRPIFVAGSTVEGKPWCEEELVLQAMDSVWQQRPEAILLLAPRHPERFDYARSLASGHGVTSATELLAGATLPDQERHTILLDTLGDLASMYELACVAFIGGSLVKRGGHNPLEAARFRVPVIMGRSYENFREIVDGLRAQQAIRIVEPADLGQAFLDLMMHGHAMGERGREFFEAQAGSTKRTVAELLRLLPEPVV